MLTKYSLFAEENEGFAVGLTIEYGKKKWKVISRSKVLDKEKNVIDYFIVALSGQQVLSFLESDIATVNKDNWKTFHTKLWNKWLSKNKRR